MSTSNPSSKENATEPASTSPHAAALIHSSDAGASKPSTMSPNTPVEAQTQTQTTSSASPELSDVSSLALATGSSSNQPCAINVDNSQLTTDEDPNRPSSEERRPSKEVTEPATGKLLPNRGNEAEQLKLNEQLASAAKNGEVELVERLLADGADVYAKDDKGDNALHIAAYNSRKDVVELLLDRKPDLVSVTGRFKWTPLQNAVMSDNDDNTETLALILNKSREEDVANVSDTGETALIQALRNQKVQSATVIKYGVETAAMIDEAEKTPLNWACENSDTRFAKLLLEEGHVRIDAQDARGRTALHSAALYGDDELMRLLVTREEYKTAVKMKDSENRTVLFDCIINKEGGKWMKKFIDDGADIAAEDSWSWTALTYACAVGSIDMVKLLVDKADVNQEPSDGYTALIVSVANNQLEQTKLLLSKGANINLATRDDGETAIHIAARSGYVEVARELLKHSPDLRIQTKENRTALELTVGMDEEECLLIGLEILKKLKESDNDIKKGNGNDIKVGVRQVASSTDWGCLSAVLDRVDWGQQSGLKEQLTLFCLASQKDESSQKILRSKLEGKTELKPENSKSWSTLHWAAYLGFPDLVWWLLERLSKIQSLKQMEATVKNVVSAVDVAWKGGYPIKKSNTEYGTAIDWLRNPPSIIVQPEIKRSFKIPEEQRKECTEKFYANITDFYKIKDDRIVFLPRVRTVEEVIYKGMGKPRSKPKDARKIDTSPGKSQGAATVDDKGETTEKGDRLGKQSQGVGEKKVIEDIGGPKQIMEDALDKLNGLKQYMNTHSATTSNVEYTKENLCFRWIHLPANNLEWMRDATRRVYQDKGTAKLGEEDCIPSILQSSCREVRGSKPEVRFLEPTCVQETIKRLKKQETSGGSQQQNPKPTIPDVGSNKANSGEDNNNLSGHEPKGPAEKKTAADGLKTHRILGLYMPYLTFGTYDPGLQKGNQPNEIQSELNQRKATEPTLDDILSKAYGKRVKGKVNEREKILGPAKSKTHDGTKVAKTTHGDQAENPITETDDIADSQYVEAILHKSRTLDEFYYDSLQETHQRNTKQVVWRYLEYTPELAAQPKASGSPAAKLKRRTDGLMDILRVDQLWLWVIDDETIITCSTNRIDIDEDLVVGGIYENLRGAVSEWKKGEATPTSVDKMAKVIMTFCIELMDRSTIKCEGSELSAREIFAKSINNAADRDKELFERFQGKIKMKLDELKKERLGFTAPKLRDSPRFRDFLPWPFKSKINGKSGNKQGEESDPSGDSATTSTPTDQEKEYESIHEATDLLIEIKDIRDELNILRYLLTLQQSVWEQLHDLHDSTQDKHSQEDDHADKVNFRKQAGRWKSPAQLIKNIEELDNNARMIQESVNSLLELEQNDASISEAEQGRKLSEETIAQGKTLMVFTLVTIVFLPLSFLTSLFAINISVFPHKGDELFYTPGFIFPWIFGSAVVTSTVAIIWAFKDRVLHHLSTRRDLKRFNAKMKQQREKSHSTVEKGHKEEVVVHRRERIFSRFLMGKRSREIDEESGKKDSREGIGSKEDRGDGGKKNMGNGIERD